MKENACALAVAMAIHMVTRGRNMEAAQNLLVELLPDSQTSCLGVRQREPKSRPWQSVYAFRFLVVLLIQGLKAPADGDMGFENYGMCVHDYALEKRSSTKWLVATHL